MVFIFSTPLNLGLDSSWGHMKVHNKTNTGVGNNTIHYPVWLLFKKAAGGCFFLFTLSDYQCERSLPHQSLLWSRWEDGGTPVLPYWHQTRYKTLWSLGWRRTSHTPTRMTDDKGPDNKQEEDNSWMCCIDWAPAKESKRRNGPWFHWASTAERRSMCWTSNSEQWHRLCKCIKWRFNHLCERSPQQQNSNCIHHRERQSVKQM